MTLENLGPLVDELCAVLHGKGCTVREVSVTYAPLAPEDVPDPGSSLQQGGRCRHPPSPTRGFQTSRQLMDGESLEPGSPMMARTQP
jgi:hypothetical protein